MTTTYYAVSCIRITPLECYNLGLNCDFFARFTQHMPNISRQHLWSVLGRTTHLVALSAASLMGLPVLLSKIARALSREVEESFDKQ